MKICDNRKKQEWPEVPEKPVPGRVYQNKHTKELHLCASGNTLINLNTGKRWATGAGFGSFGQDFKDVTDYVCLDTSRLPPLEDDE